MKVYTEDLPDVSKYLENYKSKSLEYFDGQLQSYLGPIQRYHKIDASTKILEIGTGVGWFPIRCKQRGWDCIGLEISPQLIEYAKQLGARHGVVPDIRLGNIEEADFGSEVFDIVVASNVFEHIEHWKESLAIIYRMLKPAGVLFFESTNKFSFVSHEYKGVPLYGWLPDGLRYGVRKMVQGPDIMKLGIDFNQFRHANLRKEFKKAGFSGIYDRIEIAEESAVSSEFRKKVVRLSRANSLIKAASLTFSDATRFICVK